MKRMRTRTKTLMKTLKMRLMRKRDGVVDKTTMVVMMLVMTRTPSE
ncbi:Uncharacterised protein [Mycobacteroides abscessus subsp. abscessus]|nr:Uncharacterised protein [Mycobacteroides abscessus subsp. abscessus]